MSQNNSKILGNQWITVSPVEPESLGLISWEDTIDPGIPIYPGPIYLDPIYLDPIGPGPIDPGPIDPGPIDPGPIDPGPIDPGPIDPGPIDPGPIDPGPIDPGPIGPGPIDPSNPIGSGNPIAPDPLTGNPTVNTTPSAVTRLSNPEFRILIDTTRPNEYKVEGKVTVELSEEDMGIFSIFTMRLQSTLWGEDSGSNREDNLFSFPATRLKLPGTYTFSAYVHRGTLNEDNTIFDKRDEVYNKFSIVSGNNYLQSPGIEIQSRTEHGYFG